MDVDHNGEQILDKWDDTCDWYGGDNSAWCGRFDTEEFQANDMCCECGGGASFGDCRPTAGDLLDRFDDGCAWYENNAGKCGDYDTDEFIAADLCCACGGGETL